MAETQQEFYIGVMQILKDGLIGGTHTVNGVHLSVLDTLEKVGIKGAFNRFLTEQVYRLILSSGRWAGWGLEQTLRNIPLPGGNNPLSRRQLLMVSSINGAFGDFLAQEKRVWAFPMQFSRDGQTLTLDTPSLQKTIEKPKSHVVVFVHGLCLHDRVWGIRNQPSFGQRWEGEDKITAFYLRYNSGLHIHENGRRFADMLETLITAYPAKIERLTLIGHSMGGLVSRSACSYAQDNGHTWVSLLRDLACLGSPHQGAGLERIGQLVTSTLAKSPITASLSRAGKTRSAGIKDLRYCCLRHEDWQNSHPDEHRPAQITPVPLMPEVRYCFLASNWKSPTGESLGDGLVQVSSAMARELGGHPLGTPSICRPLLQGVNHMELPRHQWVYNALDEWLFSESVKANGMLSGTLYA